MHLIYYITMLLLLYIPIGALHTCNTHLENDELQLLATNQQVYLLYYICHDIILKLLSIKYIIYVCTERGTSFSSVSLVIKTGKHRGPTCIQHTKYKYILLYTVVGLKSRQTIIIIYRDEKESWAVEKKNTPLEKKYVYWVLLSRTR